MRADSNLRLVRSVPISRRSAWICNGTREAFGTMRDSANPNRCGTSVPVSRFVCRGGAREPRCGDPLPRPIAHHCHVRAGGSHLARVPLSPHPRTRRRSTAKTTRQPFIECTPGANGKDARWPSEMGAGKTVPRGREKGEGGEALRAIRRTSLPCLLICI